MKGLKRRERQIMRGSGHRVKRAGRERKRNAGRNDKDH